MGIEKKERSGDRVKQSVLLLITLPLSILLMWSSAVTAESSLEKRCLLVYSYHVGYSWNDAVDRGASEVLQGECELLRFYMDSKRNPDPVFIREKAKQAHELIKSWKPDVILAVDDNASKFLVVPYLKQSEIPVVFAGVNWTTEEYGYPFKNMTGMVEVAPVDPLFFEAKALLQLNRKLGKKPLQVHVIDADRLSARKEYQRIRAQFEGKEMRFHAHFVETFEEWKKAFFLAQSGDLLLLQNNAGITAWGGEEAKKFVLRHGTTFSIAFHDWMRELVLLTMAKEPEEQGEWAAEAALSILSGMAPASIPVVSNRRWDIYINRQLLQQSKEPLPERLMARSQRVEEK